MTLEYPEYYSKFQCVAGNCPNTCCRGWEVDIDDETYYLYQVTKGDIGKKIRSLIQEDGEYRYFPLKENGNCPFLEKDGLCEIIRRLGYDHLCQTCDEYPRYFVQCGDYELRDLSLSCPEAARLFFASEGQVYLKEERSGEDESFAAPEWDDPSDFPFKEKSEGSEDLLEADEVPGDEDDSADSDPERDTDEDDIEDMEEEIDDEEDEDIFTKEDERVRDKILEDRDRILAVLSAEDGLLLSQKMKKAGIAYPVTEKESCTLCFKEEKIGAGWETESSFIEKTLGKKELGQAFSEKVPEAEKWFTKLAQYLVFRYWTDAFFERKPGEEADYLPEIRFVSRSLMQLYLQALSVFMRKGVLTGKDMEAVACSFSRQVEHSDENVALLKGK